MRRDLDRLVSRTFDVLVVGGGVCGLITACDAADRGLTVALVERRDFGCGASFNHLRTIHGGLRYLQTFDLARARESIRERRTLARIAPDAVQPLAFVLPLSRSVTRGKLAMRAGFLVDGMLAADRNQGLPPSHELLSGRVIGRREALERYPELRRADLTGAAIWHDYVTTDADRLTLAWAIAAAERGAVLANYVEVTALAAVGRRVSGVEAVDRLSQRSLRIDARITVNATGGGIDRLLAPLGAATGTPTVQAMNLVTRRTASDVAFGARGPTGRNFFMVPWRGRALIGTWESMDPRVADDMAVRNTDLTAFVDELNRAFPALSLSRRDIALVHRGIVPAVRRSDGTLAVRGDDVVWDHSTVAPAFDGLVSVALAKYTTARAVGERITTLLFGKLGRPGAPCRTAEAALPLSAAVCDSDLQRAVHDEMAVTLEDAVVRRTALGAVGYPGDESARRAAVVVGAALGWDEERQNREIDSLRRFYAF
jgi:glycerol-3-phosphate dehydrogenase